MILIKNLVKFSLLVMLSLGVGDVYASESGKSSSAEKVKDPRPSLSVASAKIDPQIVLSANIADAIKDNNLKTVREFFDNGENLKYINAPVTHCDENSLTGLFSLFFAQTSEMITYLIFKGANPDIQISYDQTPLMHKMYWSRYGDAQCLLNEGADINARNRFGRTALWYAIDSCNPDGVKLLLRNKARVDVPDNTGKTPLLHLLTLLLSPGISVTKSAAPKLLEMAQLLIDAGANLLHRNKQGHDITDMIASNEDLMPNSELIDFIQRTLQNMGIHGTREKLN